MSNRRWPDLVREPVFLADVTIWHALILLEGSTRPISQAAIDFFMARRKESLAVLRSDAMWDDKNDDGDRVVTGQESITADSVEPVSGDETPDIVYARIG